MFLAALGDEAAAVELTYNWDAEPYTGGRNFGHLAYAVDNIYDTCKAFIAHGVTINRPPRDGRMAFIRTGRHLHRATAGRRSAAACRTLDQLGQHRFMVERDAPAWIGSWRCWGERAPQPKATVSRKRPTCAGTMDRKGRNLAVHHASAKVGFR